MTKQHVFTGTEWLLTLLTSQGVKEIFACHNEMIFSSQCDGPGVSLRFTKLKHDQAVIHAADGYARATGKPGVAMISTASGITNAVTGIATAYSDSVPLVVLTCGTLWDDHDWKQMDEFNMIGVHVPITKQIYSVHNPDELPGIIQQAFHDAQAGRPGPVLIEIAMDALRKKPANPHKQLPFLKTSKQGTANKSFAKALEYIEKARRPVFFIGGGVIISDCGNILSEIVHKTGIPVVSSLMGIGALPAEDPLFLGMLGMHGTYAANKAVHQADVLISIGVRFSDRVTGRVNSFSPRSEKIHVDIDPAEINKIIQVDLPIVSDAKEFLLFLKEELNHQIVKEHIIEWRTRACEWQRTVPRFDHSNSILRPQDVIQILNEQSGKDTVVVTDVGQHQIWTAHYYKFSKPRTLLTSGGLGTMGYGLPAAIGAAVANPTGQVILVTGDGSFQMNLQEMMTVSSYQLPIKIVILNNGYLGMVRQWQEMFYERRYSSVKMTSPNFSKLASAYGFTGSFASTPEEARQVISKAFTQCGPVLMEFNVVEEENVYPIVPPNHSNDELIMSR